MSVQFAIKRTPGAMELSKRAALRTHANDIPEVLPGARDERIAEDRLINDNHREQLQQLLESTLAHHSIDLDESRKARVLANIVQIHQTVSRIRENYLDLGKCLLRIYRESAEVYEEISRKGSRILPFDYTVAIKCRRIAEAVECGLLPECALPAAYTTAYEIATMDEATLRLAEAKGLIRPDVGRNEIVRHKQAARTLVQHHVETVASLAARIAHLEERKQAIIAEAQARVAKIECDIAILADRKAAFQGAVRNQGREVSGS
jgi:hypothetical protein